MVSSHYLIFWIKNLSFYFEPRCPGDLLNLPFERLFACPVKGPDGGMSSSFYCTDFSNSEEDFFRSFLRASTSISLSSSLSSLPTHKDRMSRITFVGPQGLSASS